MNRFYAAAIAALFLCVSLVASPLRAQSPTLGTSPSADAALPTDAELGEAAPAVRGLHDVTPKTLIFVFDVSGSMRGALLRRAREATINIISEGTAPGDRVVLFTFGADYHKVFDATLGSEADKKALIAQVPTEPEPGAGTNIRKPHHEALKLLESELPKRGAVVLLTDSYNDEPNQTDSTYPTYLQYYTPGGRLKKYPDTPENRDYDRLLRLMTDSKKVDIYGIGVQIDKSGRPIERLPVAEPSASPEIAETPAAPTAPVVVGGDSKPNPLMTWVYAALGLVCAALIAGFVIFSRGTKPVALRIKGGGTVKDFELRSGQNVLIGGANALGFDAYALLGTSAPVAVLRSVGNGRFAVAPAPVTIGTSPATGVPSKVSVNGAPLERETTLQFGDEMRIAVPDSSGAGTIKEYRLTFDDPTKSF